MTEKLVSAVHNDAQGEHFDEREKAAFRLVDVIAGDHHKASDALYDDLREHFTEPEIITLGWRISRFMGYGRLLATLGMDTVGEAVRVTGRRGGLVRSRKQNGWRPVAAAARSFVLTRGSVMVPSGAHARGRPWSASPHSRNTRATMKGY